MIKKNDMRRFMYVFTIICVLSFCLANDDIIMNNEPLVTEILSKKIKPEAVIKNNRGVVLMTECMSNVDSLKLAIRYFDEAIAIDSSYVLAYVNKAEVFNRMNESQKSINLLIFATRKLSDDRYLPLLLGQRYEHLGKKDSAQYYYKKLTMTYNNLIQTHPDSVSLRVGRLVALSAIHGEQTMNIADSIRLFEKKDPDSEALKLFKKSFLMKQMYDSIPKTNLYK